MDTHGDPVRSHRDIRLRPLAPGMDVLSESTNAGVLRRNGRVLLINGAGSAALTWAGIRPEDVEWVLVTHHYRSAAEGLDELVSAGAKVAVPERERSLFEHAETFWAEDHTYRVHCYNYHPSPRTLRESVPVARALRDGEVFEWQGVRIRAMATPGPTAGGMTYVVDAGEAKVAFIGDLMSAPGKLWEFYSLQGRRPMPDGGQMMEYHGFGERAADVLSSLERVVQAGASLLVPSRGDVIRHPRPAVDALRANVNACLTNYESISAARWYFAGVRPAWPADRTPMMPRLRRLPSWVREVGGTSRALVADGGQAFVMDCCGDIPDRLLEQQQRKAIGPVEAIWVTHYHDDHVGSVNALRAQQHCPVIAHETMADILRRPDAYLMPCLDPNPVAVDRVTRDGESWEWRGVKLTAYSFPGQTIYDAALLAQRAEESVLFVGDSLGPGGIDDYCTHNRDLLGPGLGFDRCLALLQRLSFSGLLVNPHVEGAFAFSRTEIEAMRETLAQRGKLFSRLIDWDDPNYGLDPQWVRCDPYLQAARPGDQIEWQVRIRDYSLGSRTAVVGLRAPGRWRPSAPEGTVRVRPGKEGSVQLAAAIPNDWPPGRVVVGFTLRYGGRPLGEMAEGIVDVLAAGGR